MGRIIRAYFCLPMLVMLAALAFSGCGFFLFPAEEEPIQSFTAPAEDTALPEVTPEPAQQEEELPEVTPEAGAGGATPQTAVPDALEQAEGAAGVPPTDETGGADDPALTSGKKMIFEFNELSLNITGVAARESISWNDELGHSHETPVYVLLPGAKLSIIAADMVEGSLTESGEPLANWRIYRDNDEPIPLVDDMAPLEITADMGGVGAENVYVLKFRMTGDI